jgi:hypothetical protein
VRRLERLQIGDEVVDLSFIEDVAEWRHHGTPSEDVLADVLVGERDSAGQRLLVIQALQSGTVQWFCRVGVVADGALQVKGVLAAKRFG